LVGVSGDAVSNVLLTFYNRTIQQAVATSAGIGVPITIAGTIGYAVAGSRYMPQLPPLSVGFVSLIGFALMAPLSSFTASYGVRLAHWMPKRKLEIAFACFLALASARFLFSIFLQGRIAPPCRCVSECPFRSSRNAHYSALLCQTACSACARFQ
jgi:uncharacterized membrane protein YfcA